MKKFAELQATDERVYALKSIGCSISMIQYILGISPFEIKRIISNNKQRPDTLPNGYYITRLANGKTVKDIANELHCTRATIYRLLERRGISLYAYRKNNP